MSIACSLARHESECLLCRYDAVAATALLACHVAPTGPLPDDFGTRMWEARQQVEFDGLSGHVKFDDVGNRDSSTANIELLNILLVSNGSNGSFASLQRARYLNDSWVWNGGARNASGLVRLPTHAS